MRVEGVAAPKPEKRVKAPKVKPPRTRIKKQNKERKAARFISDFGGAEYHAYIVGLPCDICGVVGFTVAAHLTSRGAGGKAADTAPLCCTRPHGVFPAEFIVGCHEKYDARDKVIRAHEPRLRELAKARHSAFTFAISHAA